MTERRGEEREKIDKYTKNNVKFEGKNCRNFSPAKDSITQLVNNVLQEKIQQISFAFTY